MGFLHKLWDETLAGPMPDTGLGKLRKYYSFSVRSSSPVNASSANRNGELNVTRSITIIRTSSSNLRNLWHVSYTISLLKQYFTNIYTYTMYLCMYVRSYVSSSFSCKRGWFVFMLIWAFGHACSRDTARGFQKEKIASWSIRKRRA